MTDGIFNPFGDTKPKKNKPATPFDAEAPTPSVGHIRLEGGSHTVVLKETVLEDVRKRLGNLILDAQEKHPEALTRHGIRLVREIVQPIEDSEASLDVPEGHLIVFIGPNTPQKKVEDEAFRRIGHALKQLNDLELLDQHNVEIIERGN